MHGVSGRPARAPTRLACGARVWSSVTCAPHVSAAMVSSSLLGVSEALLPPPGPSSCSAGSSLTLGGRRAGDICGDLLGTPALGGGVGYVGPVGSSPPFLRLEAFGGGGSRVGGAGRGRTSPHYRRRGALAVGARPLQMPVPRGLLCSDRVAGTSGSPCSRSLAGAGAPSCGPIVCPQVYFCRSLALAFLELTVLRRFHEHTHQPGVPPLLRAPLWRLSALYGLWSLSQHMALLYRGEALAPEARCPRRGATRPVLGAVADGGLGATVRGQVGRAASGRCPRGSDWSLGRVGGGVPGIPGD